MKTGIYYNENYQDKSVENPLPPQSVVITVRKVMNKTCDAVVIWYEGNGHKYKRIAKERWIKSAVEWLINDYQLKYIGETWQS